MILTIILAMLFRSYVAKKLRTNKIWINSNLTLSENTLVIGRNNETRTVEAKVFSRISGTNALKISAPA